MMKLLSLRNKKNPVCSTIWYSGKLRMFFITKSILEVCWVKIKKPIYKPSWISIINDIMILILSLFVVLEWFPLTTRTPYEKYDVASVFYVFIWVFVSYLLGRYKPLHKQKYLKASFKLMYITLIVFGAMWLISFTYFTSIYSVYVIFTFTTIAFAINFLFFILYFVLCMQLANGNPIKIKMTVVETANFRVSQRVCANWGSTWVINYKL